MDFCQDAIHIAKALLECCSFLTIQLSFISHLWKLFCLFICSIDLENQSKVSLLDGDLWGRGEGGFPSHTETLSKRTSELRIVFYPPDNFISLPTPPHTQRWTSIHYETLVFLYIFKKKWYSKASHWFFDKWLMQKLAWQPTGMNKLIPIKSPPWMITIFFNGQFCAKREIPTGRSFVSLSQSFNATVK